MQKVYRDAPLAAPPVAIPFVVFASTEDNAVVAFTAKIISADGPKEAMGPVAARYSAELEPVEWVWHPVDPAAEPVQYVRGTRRTRPARGGSRADACRGRASRRGRAQGH